MDGHGDPDIIPETSVFTCKTITKSTTVEQGENVSNTVKKVTYQHL